VSLNEVNKSISCSAKFIMFRIFIPMVSVCLLMPLIMVFCGIG